MTCPPARTVTCLQSQRAAKQESTENGVTVSCRQMEQNTWAHYTPVSMTSCETTKAFSCTHSKPPNAACGSNTHAKLGVYNKLRPKQSGACRRTLVSRCVQRSIHTWRAMSGRAPSSGTWRAWCSDRNMWKPKMSALTMVQKSPICHPSTPAKAPIQGLSAMVQPGESQTNDWSLAYCIRFSCLSRSFLSVLSLASLFSNLIAPGTRNKSCLDTPAIDVIM